MNVLSLNKGVDKKITYVCLIDMPTNQGIDLGT